MAERLPLSGTDWQLAGFHGEDWRFRAAYRRETRVKPHEWLPAMVPGSIHWDLLRAGEIPDPYFERNSRLVEWVHQRHWVYRREFTVPENWDGRRIRLRFDGIDYESEIFLDGALLGEHRSMFRPAVFDVTDRVKPGQTHLLVVAIKDAPREWGQLGRTSTVHTQKARFGYWWDFGTRLVNLGIWQGVWLEATGQASIADVWVRANPDGTVRVVTDSDGAPAITVLSPDGTVVAGAAGADVTVTIEHPRLWWPHELGAQPLYTARVTVDGDQREVRFGIRSFALRQNPWPYQGEQPLPYTFTVNDRPLFVKGFNWVPVDHMYGRPDLAERYAELIRTAKAAGCNLIRVWGGGLIERELFYDLCDREGLLIWQEFIQSSSGTDNVPPADPAYLELLAAEADWAIRARRNHPSLALWCGGNELTGLDRHPATLGETALALLAAKVAELDPGRPFLPSSPSGPLFDCGDFTGREHPADMHDVHGPWHYRGPVESYLPYNNSTALFHSEFGTQGALAPASLNRIMAAEHQWPPNDTNPIWVHHGAWWMQLHRVRELFGDTEGIDRYWHFSQYLQAENLRYGVESNRRRPVCSGTIIWQLNEPWPNGHNTAVVDYYLRPKMAYYYVKRAYASATASLRYDGPILADGVLRAQPYVVSDRPFGGKLTVTVSDPSGRVWLTQAGAGALEWRLPDDCPDIIIVTLTLIGPDETVVAVNPYLFSRAPAPIFSGLAALPAVEVDVTREGDRLILTNRGAVCAFFPAVDIDDSRWYWRLTDNYPLLAPGESAAIGVALAPRGERADTDFPAERPAAGPLVVTVTGWNVRRQTLTWEV